MNHRRQAGSVPKLIALGVAGYFLARLFQQVTQLSRIGAVVNPTSGVFSDTA
jgi:hypothetical protein